MLSEAGAFALSNWVALTSAIVSLLAALSASVNRRRQMRIAWNTDFIAWARDAMAALAEARVLSAHLKEIGAEDAAARVLSLRSRMSASVDHGRLFFENIKGLRPRVLDPLIGGYRLLGECSSHDPLVLERSFDVHRTNFWRRAQRIVGPSWVRKTVQVKSDTAGDGAHDYSDPSLDADEG